MMCSIWVNSNSLKQVPGDLACFVAALRIVNPLGLLWELNLWLVDFIDLTLTHKLWSWLGSKEGTNGEECIWDCKDDEDEYWIATEVIAAIV